MIAATTTTTTTTTTVITSIVGSNLRVKSAGYNGKLRGADEEVQAGELLRV